MRVLITGGAGFIGVNTAAYYLAQKAHVTIYDSFDRKGTRANANWLTQTYPTVEIVEADIRDEKKIRPAVKNQDIIFHFAAQVAVTTSVADPMHDFSVNTLGTVTLLEAVRCAKTDPILIYSSTNKVYGNLPHASVKEQKNRYVFTNRPYGIGEEEPLDFHSPYGCSKGSADQYVRDYARIYGIRTVVLRQSCIYGPHQFGIEDQGWVAWMLIATLLGKPITIYGNGKQVRDLLYIDDLCAVYDAIITRIKTTAGQVYNIGGGQANALSIWGEFGPMLTAITGKHPKVIYKPIRPGDQPIFIADIRKTTRDVGWTPATSVKHGIRLLWEWVKEHEEDIRVFQR